MLSCTGECGTDSEASSTFPVTDRMREKESSLFESISLSPVRFLEQIWVDTHASSFSRTLAPLILKLVCSYS